MKLDYRTRAIELPGGITVKCKPLETWAYQEWIDFVARITTGTKELDERQASLRIATSEEGRTLIAKILTAHVIEIVGLEIQEDGGVRNGTVQDLLGLGGAYTRYAFRMISALVKSSSLTEADLGNSAAPPVAS